MPPAEAFLPVLKLIHDQEPIFARLEPVMAGLFQLAKEAPDLHLLVGEIRAQCDAQMWSAATRLLPGLDELRRGLELMNAELGGEQPAKDRARPGPKGKLFQHKWAHGIAQEIAQLLSQANGGRKFSMGKDHAPVMRIGAAIWEEFYGGPVKIATFAEWVREGGENPKKEI
jgi:hypothetical protein